MKRLLGLLTALMFAGSAQAADKVQPRDGWVVHDTTLTYAELVERMKPAIKANGMGLVTQAGPTGAAKARGITIPGNRVFGIFNNDFAVRTLAASVNAMIEAPIRMYATENLDGTASLSYKMPSHVFTPYFVDGGDELKSIASELDEKFRQIAAAILKR
jgi:uncharacterized protein (DUF302 family)